VFIKNNVGLTDGDLNPHYSGDITHKHPLFEEKKIDLRTYGLKQLQKRRYCK